MEDRAGTAAGTLQMFAADLRLTGLGLGVEGVGVEGVGVDCHRSWENQNLSQLNAPRKQPEVCASSCVIFGTE